MTENTGRSSLKAKAEDRQLYENLARFRFAIRQFLDASDSITSAAGTTAQQYQAILAIEANPDSGMAIKALAEQMLLVPHGAVQLVNRLETAGLAKRERSNDDRRQVKVALTAKGRRTLRKLAHRHLQELLTHEQLLVESLKRLRLLTGQPDS